MSSALIWLSGFAMCGAISLVLKGDPWGGFLVVCSFVCIDLAARNRRSRA